MNLSKLPIPTDKEVAIAVQFLVHYPNASKIVDGIRKALDTVQKEDQTVTICFGASEVGTIKAWHVCAMALMSEYIKEGHAGPFFEVKVKGDESEDVASSEEENA